MKGPETVMLDEKGTMYALVRGAKLVRLENFEPKKDDPHTVTANVTIAFDMGIGAPLGGSFTPDGSALYFADALMGLVRIKRDPHARIELVANKVMDDGVLTRILYADDVTVGPKTGTVYFSDGKCFLCLRPAENEFPECSDFLRLHNFDSNRCPIRTSDW